ncbi:MAG: hypothetical protein LBH22_06110 [Bacteroidales bacterium]|jgi:hypothetical protein|nr:hypothetical protein [Bacteroidales bacterium]
MKKVFAIFAIASMMSFVACNNAPKTDAVVEDEMAIVDFEDGDEEIVEEEVEEPAK